MSVVWRCQLPGSFAALVDPPLVGRGDAEWTALRALGPQAPPLDLLGLGPAPLDAVLEIDIEALQTPQ